MGVRIGKYPRLKHLVRRKTDPGHDVRRRERHLFDLGKVIVGVAIQFKDAHLDKRVVGVRPHLGQIEWIERRILCIRFGHDLDAKTPFGKVAVFDGVIQIFLG